MIDLDVFEEELLEYGESIDYCRCGHSDLSHVSPALPIGEYLEYLDDLTKEVRYHCTKCGCVNFR